MVLRGIDGKVDICQTDYDIPNWEFSLIQMSYMVVFCSFFNFLHHNVSDNKCHKQKWCVLFFTCIKLVVRVLACAHAIAHIKWRRLCHMWRHQFLDTWGYGSWNHREKEEGLTKEIMERVCKEGYGTIWLKKRGCIRWKEIARVY